MPLGDLFRAYVQYMPSICSTYAEYMLRTGILGTSLGAESLEFRDKALRYLVYAEHMLSIYLTK